MFRTQCSRGGESEESERKILIRFRSLLHRTDLLHQADLVVEQPLFDYQPIPPQSYGAELDSELLVCGLYCLSVRGLHRALDRAGEIRNRARVVAACEKYLVRPVAYAVVGEGLEELYGLRPVVVDSPCRLGLSGSENGAVFGVALHERVPVLRVPGVVQSLHELHVLLLYAVCHDVNWVCFLFMSGSMPQTTRSGTTYWLGAGLLLFFNT